MCCQAFCYLEYSREAQCRRHLPVYSIREMNELLNLKLAVSEFLIMSGTFVMFVEVVKE